MFWTQFTIIVVDGTHAQLAATQCVLVRVRMGL